MNDKMKKHILSNWDKYNMVDSREEMVKVLNILEAHDENLDTLHDIVMGNTEWLCGIWMTSNPQTDREVKDILYDFNDFYRTMAEMCEDVKEMAEDCEMTIDEFLATEDIRETSDGFVRVFYY